MTTETDEMHDKSPHRPSPRGIRLFPFNQLSQPAEPSELSQLELRRTERLAQKRYILKVLVLTIIAVPLMQAAMAIYWFTLLPFFAPVILVMFIWLKAIISDESFLDVLRDNFTFIPVEYSEKEWWGERRLYATHVLILINVAIHYVLVILGEPSREAIINALSFVPENLQAWNVIISPLTSIFLHADDGHLWWNMVFLWVFGLVLERRIGWRRFAFFYLITGVISSLISGAVDVIFFKEFTQGIGASGAISGIIGVFAVRLYYKSLVFPIPLLGLFSFVFPLHLKVRTSSIFVIALYFLSDIKGGIATLLGTQAEIGYWAHIGGIAAGILLALQLKLQDQAAEDMYTEKALAAIEKDSGLAEADRVLRRVLQLNPENEAAMLLLARRKSQSVPEEEGRKLYQRLIRQLLETSPDRAAEIFVEYFSIYWLPLAPDAQYSLTFHLRRGGWAWVAAHALECIVENPATSRRWAELCFLKLGQILEELGLPEAACFRYEQLLKRYPDSAHRSLVLYRMKRLMNG